jgi:hypothetical protein
MADGGLPCDLLGIIHCTLGVAACGTQSVTVDFVQGMPVRADSLALSVVGFSDAFDVAEVVAVSQDLLQLARRDGRACRMGLGGAVSQSCGVQCVTQVPERILAGGE